MRAWVLAPEAGAPTASEVRVFGLSARERLRRGLLRAGVASIDRLEPGDPVPAASGPCLVLRDGLFYDERVLASLLGAHDVALADPLGETTPVAARCEAVGSLKCDVLGELIFWARARENKMS